MNNENKEVENQETVSRKDSHLQLALTAQNNFVDQRFNYEPMLAAHPKAGEQWETTFGSKTMNFPIWISSMTGGTSKANEINQRLARIVKKYGLGMGVGSARIALEDESKAKDFELRPLLKDAPFYLNFGIAQVEKYMAAGQIEKFKALRKRVDADGFIIHVNPLQEWLQPSGDKINEPPVNTIAQFIQEADAPLIVKEVGQGFGPASMRALLLLPLVAIEFAAAGGTNFSMLELMRNNEEAQLLNPFVHVGHEAKDMSKYLNQLIDQLGGGVQCQSVIISGGIKNFLDGFYFIKKAKINALYGQASQFLKYAMQSEEALDLFVAKQTEGLILAKTFLNIKE